MPGFRGAIFDVDGVLVDSPHEKAWRESLRELMESDWQDIRERTTWSPDAFGARVYEQYVSGKPRMSGARAALDYFNVPDADKRVAEYAQRKQEMVLRLIDAGDFTAYPDALRFVITTKEAGLRIADASSSKNATSFLSKIRLDTFAQENRHFRTDRETGHFLAGLLRRRSVGPRLRPRKARPRDLPHRRTRTRRRATGGDSDGRRRGRRRGGQAGRHERDRDCPSRRRGATRGC